MLKQFRGNVEKLLRANETAAVEIERLKAEEKFDLPSTSGVTCIVCRRDRFAEHVRMILDDRERLRAVVDAAEQDWSDHGPTYRPDEGAENG